MLTPEKIAIIKATAKPVKANALAITTRMYEILFKDFPEVEELFKNSDPEQHKKLANAIGAYAANIDNLAALSGAVDKMVSVHVLKKVKPEHYPMVGVSLLKAIKDVLGDAATDEVLDAWKDAYFLLADILIAKEKEVYAKS